LQHIVRNKYYNLNISIKTIRPVNAEIYTNTISIFTPSQLFIILQDDNQIHANACIYQWISNILFAKWEPINWHHLYISIITIHCALVEIWASVIYPSESAETIISVIWYHIIDHNFRPTCTTTFIQNTFDRTIQIHSVTVFERLVHDILGTDTISQSWHIENHDEKTTPTRTMITQSIFVLLLWWFVHSIDRSLRI
jgi:hypothetical protein